VINIISYQTKKIKIPNERPKIQTIMQIHIKETNRFKRWSMRKTEIAKTWGSTDFESDPIGS
jgi:hypothetical protein